MSSLAFTCPTVRRIGILTGGGDCPGLNAVIRAVARDAFHCGIRVIGVEDGYLGLIEGRTRELTEADLRGILNQGGTILGSNNKSNPSRHKVGVDADGKPIYRDVMPECLRTLERAGIQALVAIGGDGTHTAAAMFARLGVPVIGVPKTIDNDIEGTEITFGFQSAVATATLALDQVRTTADSHHRAMVVEVMGRNAGWIALHAGLASGSDVILIPEIPFSLDTVYALVRDRGSKGKRSSLICVSEGARLEGGKQIVARRIETSPDPIRLGGIAKFLADKIEDETGVESRYTILGHTQRGGTPVAADRVLGTLLGSHAMTLLREGKVGRMVAVQRGGLTDIDLATPAGRQRLVRHDDPHVLAARNVGSVFGDEGGVFR
ncbi:MAG TPA: ATP-dependent 6-phosphofructokinase [Phycisphaerales bacterium]|nr:ATP-dependent 6-phosphofructokinase [Phycisphaerales bacterium]